MIKHEGKLYNCAYCTRTFKTKYGLDSHVPEHTGVYPFTCHICSKGFILRAKLEAHVNQHVGIGYTCWKCDKTMYSQKEFKKHTEKCNLEVPRELEEQCSKEPGQLDVFPK